MTDAVIEFAKRVIQESVFDGYDLDSGIVQEMALELGLLTKTKYDPEKHGEDEYAEPGDDWYVFSNLLTQIDPSPAPEAQQEPVAWRWKPKDSAAWIYDPKPEWLEAQSRDEIDAEPLFTRPSGQAVTEAMVEAAQRIRDVAMQQTVIARLPECGEFGAIAQDADWLVDALKAAMEARG